MYVEPAPEAQFQGLALPECLSRTQDFSAGLGNQSAQKINDMSYDQLISEPPTYVKVRTQRSDDAIFMRLMDDVVGMGPEGHLMSDF